MVLAIRSPADGRAAHLFIPIMRKTCLVTCLITAILPAFLATAFAQQAAFSWVSQPEQSDIQPSGFRLTWRTTLPTTAAVFYGTSPTDLALAMPVSENADSHAVALTGLQPGTIYWVRVAGIRNADTVFSATRPFATQSLSSGQIKVYFSHGIDPLASNGLLPDGETFQDVHQEILTRINAAQQTLDVAMYNTNRTDLVAAMRAAHERGVRVRYIAAKATANTALKPAPPFPVLYGNDSSLMHNKFLVIDADRPDSAWIMSGSMNWTNTNMVHDHNNSLFIQDQSLARAYELEFNEMWGGNGPMPNLEASRFGKDKTDNTPHHFVVGGRPVALYFSPTDQVTRRIEECMHTANHQAAFALFSFTKNELGNAMIARHQSGTWVRGIIENINDQGTEFGWLRSNGVPVQAHPPAPAIHHKYAVVDAGYPDSDPMVVTGSHNWSQNAESNNDENTLILRDPDLAVLFQAEFERRWGEINTQVVDIGGQAFAYFPNPVRDRLFLRQKDDAAWTASVEIWDMAGRLWQKSTVAGPQAEIRWPDDAPAGQYVLFIRTEHGATSISVQAFPR